MQLYEQYNCMLLNVKYNTYWIDKLDGGADKRCSFDFELILNWLININLKIFFFHI